MDLILSHSRTLSRSFSLIFFNVEQSAASQTKLQSSPEKAPLELESLSRHVGGGVEAVGAPLDGLGDQRIVLIDLE